MKGKVGVLGVDWFVWFSSDTV